MKRRKKLYNQFIGIGHLVADAMLRYLPSGTAISDFKIAMNYKYGEKDEVLFMPCTLFGKFAEAVSPYLNKGGLVMVEGRLKEERWQSDGREVRMIKVIVSNLKLLSKNTEKTSDKLDKNKTEDPVEDDFELEAF